MIILHSAEDNHVYFEFDFKSISAAAVFFKRKSIDSRNTLYHLVCRIAMKISTVFQKILKKYVHKRPINFNNI